MLIAIISDIHSNAEALNAVLKEINKIKPDKIFCAGDIVGYGPEPELCIEIIRDLEIQTVCGNHDLACAGLVDLNSFSESAKEAILWTQAQLNEDDISFLSELPFIVNDDSFCITHASFSHPELFEYILSPVDIEKSLSTLTKKAGFIGHSHIPIMYYADGNSTKTIKAANFTLKNGKTVINVGSIGQPRDGNPQSCFVLFSTEKKEISYKRVNYNYKNTYQKIIDEGLPKKLAERLFFGI